MNANYGRPRLLVSLGAVGESDPLDLRLHRYCGRLGNS